jgi:hypothetical protein
LGDILKRFFPDHLHLLTGPWHFARSDFERSGRDPSAPYPEDGKKNAYSLIETVHQECVEAGLRTSAITASNLLASLKSDSKIEMQGYVALLEELSRRVTDELKCEYFLQLNIAEADRYENWQKGWETILERHPEAMRDVEEMNKCFALGRYTASMFHALHVAERGAIALGDCIDVPDPKKGWGPTERKLRDIIKGGHANLPGPLVGKFEFLEQMNREIDSMVLAWRNKVDHAANHLAIVPNTDFTPDIAEHIIGAVRIFMQRLIEGIPDPYPNLTALSRLSEHTA